MNLSSNSQLCNQLQYALFAADMAILIEDENRKIQFVNQAYCDLLELPMKPEELIGCDYNTTMVFTKYLFDDSNHYQTLAVQFENDKKIQRNDKLITKSGNIILREYVPMIENGINKGNVWYLKKTEVTENLVDNTQIISSFVTDNNITEIIEEEKLQMPLLPLQINNSDAGLINDIEKANAVLQNTVEKYSRIINSLNDIVFAIDIDGTITYLNKSWERLAESKLEDSMHKNIKSYFTENHYDQDIQFEKLIMQANGDVEDNVYPFIAQSGFKWVSIDVEATYEQGMHKGYSGIMIDVTEKILAEKQLQINYQKEKKY